jgi:glycosyltransferase involved in cell wall biosynthesis
MKLGEARIGYAGYSADCSAPGDRRRFSAYAANRGLSFARAELGQDYDLVVVTHNGDIAGWTARKRRDGSRLRFVFELADSYLMQTGLLRRYLKGAARFALGIDSRPSTDFLRTLIGACEAADAVICSTDEQAAMIRRYNPNVIVSFDYFGDDISGPKIDYRREGKLRLVWEGQSTTLGNLLTVREVLNDFRDKVELHVVTDPLVYRYFGRYLPHRSQDLLTGIACDVRFHRWDRSSFSEHITSSDLAIIPIDPSNAFACGKPENKLVMLWQLGMPVLTSDTPAYRRAMEAAGQDLLCGDLNDWRSRLARLIEAGAEDLAIIAHQGRSFAERAYSRDEFLARFDEAFEAAGFRV